MVVGAADHIGRPLCRELILAGHAVAVFSGDPSQARHLAPGAVEYVAWSPQSLTEQCGRHLESADAVVYLAGAPLFDGDRHSRADVMTESRARAGALGHLVTTLGGLSKVSAAGHQFGFPVLDAAPRDLPGQPDDPGAER